MGQPCLYPSSRDALRRVLEWHVELAREHEPGNQHEGFKAEKHVAVPASYNDLYAEEGFRMWKDGMWYQRDSRCRNAARRAPRAAVRRRRWHAL